MALVVETFNGTDINTSTFVPRLEGADNIEALGISPVVVHPSGRNGRFIRADVQPRIIPVHIMVTASIDANMIVLAQTFTRGITGEFVVTYNGTSRALTCRVERTIMYDRSYNQFTAVLVAEDPMWHSSALQTVTQQQTVSAATWAVANDGNAADYTGIYTVQTKTAKLTASGYTFKREYIIANRVARPFNNYALMFTIDHAALTTAKSLANGNDLRVRVDGVETPRWVNTSAGRTWDQATTDVWFNLTLSPAKTAVLLTAAASGASPADGSEIEVVKGGTNGWPIAGAFVIGDEVITYTGITLKNASGHECFTGIDRAARTSTGAAHSAGDVLYWIERRVQVIYGYSGAAAPDARNELKPMLDFTDASLSNTSHRWLDFADSANPLRSMQWARRLVNRDDQAQFVQAPTGAPAAALTLNYDVDGAAVGYPNFNQWERDIPSGSDGNIAPTRVIADTMALQIFTVDADGNELKGTVANNGLLFGPLTSGSANHDPGDVYGIRFYGFNQIIASTGPNSAAGGTAALPNGASSSAQGQQFISGDEAISIQQISIYCQDDSTPRNVTATIRFDDAADAPSGTLYATGSAVATDGTGGGQWITSVFSPAIVIPPNTKFWVCPYANAAAAVQWYISTLPYSGGYKRDGSTNLRAVSFNVRIIGKAAAGADSLIRLDDNAVADDGDTVSITSLIVPLLATGIPYLNLLAEAACYWNNAVLSNDTTVQTATFDVICVDEDEIEVDVGRRTVKNVTNPENLLQCVKFSDPDEWIRLAPGSNTFKLTEAGIVREDVIAETYDRYL